MCKSLVKIQAVSWPILSPDQDDGVKPTHFTYESSPWREEIQAALQLGLLPEIHLWIGLPDENELIDFSTKYLPQQAAQDGLEWKTEPPPDFLWCGPSDLPEGVIYRPDMEAIRFALRFIRAHQRHAEGAVAAGTNLPLSQIRKR